MRVIARLLGLLVQAFSGVLVTLFLLVTAAGVRFMQLPAMLVDSGEIAF